MITEYMLDYCRIQLVKSILVFGMCSWWNQISVSGTAGIIGFMLDDCHLQLALAGSVSSATSKIGSILDHCCVQMAHSGSVFMYSW